MFNKLQLMPRVTGNASHVPSLTEHYQSLVDNRHLQHDPAQIRVIEQLQALSQQVVLVDKCQKKSLWSTRFSGATAISFKHLYIHGGVGHGKSMLMDLFFTHCPVKRKRRVHFHAFMQEVHHFIHQWEEEHKGDVLIALAGEIRDSTLLLCFDEFHVTDIADAMVMERLFRTLFDLGVIVVMTSNRHPDDLYRGGLLREQFVPFVELLLERAEIVPLDGDVDYRAIKPNHSERRYFAPLNTDAEAFALQCYRRHARTDQLKAGHIEVFGREIFLTAVHDNVLLTSFAELCQQALGAADYLFIAQHFEVIIMTGIPKLEPEFCDAAKRFETLVDALYEYKVLFYCTAEAQPREIYKSGEGAFEFKRTVSRLLEMQSGGYALAENVCEVN